MKTFVKNVFINQKTKVKKLKTIKYHCNFNYKLCRLKIERCYYFDSFNIL